VSEEDGATLIQALIRSGQAVDERRVADPDVALTDLIPLESWGKTRPPGDAKT
jgi:hypothetical protein